ncbi:MAG: hypothetical protein ACRDGM_14800 [bacterium]
MNHALAADAACVVAALYKERAWFRHGLTDHRIVEVTGLPVERVVAARRHAQYDGLIERISRAGETVTMLTPLGVARAHATGAPA